MRIVKTTKSADRRVSTTIFSAALDLRRMPLPTLEVPHKQRMFKWIYRVGIEAGYRGWQLEQYFRFTGGRPERREALDAGFHAGESALVRRLQRQLRSQGIPPTTLLWRLPGSEWPNPAARAKAGTGLLDREKDWRRAPLPNPPSLEKYFCSPLQYAYDNGFEAGYRGWAQRLNVYQRSDFRQAWSEGYDAGEVALRKRLTEAADSADYGSGFRSGFTGKCREAVRPGCQTDAWRVGYRDGRRFGRKAVSKSQILNARKAS